MKTHRLLVTGARRVTPEQAHHVGAWLTKIWFSVDPDVQLIIVHGAAPGVDTAAEEWAVGMVGVTTEPHPADWDTHGKKAGPIRNAEMVATRPDACVGFPGVGSRGTWDCLKQAVDAGIKTRVYPLPPEERS